MFKTTLKAVAIGVAAVSALAVLPQVQAQAPMVGAQVRE